MPNITNFSGLAVKGKPLATGVLNATAVLDPASIAAAGQASLNVTVPGAALGDYVLAAAPYDLLGVGLHGYVSAQDTVTLLFKNGTAAAVDLVSGTYKVKVLKG